MQSILSHTNILPLLGIAEAREHKLSASLVLPWMENTDSRTYLKKNPHVLRLPLILGTIRGIAFLHSKRIVHGDIKARNVLISDDGTPLLSDFGLTSFAEEDDREMSHSMVPAGSPAWMAIELHESRTPALAVTKYSDMWAFGMTIIELLTGKSPFPSGGAWKVIMYHDYDNYPKKPTAEECTDTLWELTQRCWKEEPTSRPTADESAHLIESIPAPLPS
ncbi:kinase-like protein [Fomitiporia mediterranea MF3/22]|uniref:kinase-like protein n=1 Tax=Fomitiporia mediterranea (strain MF3/22) TaxID=694068 RepID=UPI0004409388|nr:kinase-like protein [Fomitiporia mediterranea MF3/22]EJD08482.1 kinase-like protein [Fomitiporia mediterranea MF3/22]